MHNNNIFLIHNKTIKQIQETILACLLNKHEESEDIFLNLNNDDFDDYKYQIIFEVCEILAKNGNVHDFLTVTSFIDNNSKYQFNEYQNYISYINNKYLYEPSLKEYIEVLKNYSITKKIHNFAKKILTINLNIDNANELIWEIEKNFFDILSSKQAKNIKKINEIMNKYEEKLAQIKNAYHALTGTTSGYDAIDKITNGFQPGDLIILAARPGIGKTAIALNFLLNAAHWISEKQVKLTNNEKPEAVLMFSMEMGGNQIAERMVSIQSCVNMESIKKGQLSNIELSSVFEAISSIKSYPIFIDESSSLTIVDIQNKIKQLSFKVDLKLVIVDYLQLLSGPKNVVNVNRQQEVANISRTLKSIARNYNVPIIAIAQLSRKIEERRGDQKRPILSDLRESGAIEQDADIVTFLNYKNIENDDNMWINNQEVMVEYIIAKHRNGMTGIIDLQFLKKIGKYIELKTVKDKYEN